MATRDEIWTASFTQDHMKRAMEYGLTALRTSLADSFEQNIHLRDLDSPLEAAFLAWWLAVDSERSYSHEVNLSAQREIDLEGQRFRIDFIVEPADPNLYARAAQRHQPIPRIAVELDGHDFHERTKEQVTRRDVRDRALVAAGWLVLHFSGSEFHRDPVACVDAVHSAAVSAFWGLRHRIWALDREHQDGTEP